MGCVAGVKSVEDVGQSPSSGGQANAGHDPDFHAKYMLDEIIGKGSCARVHAVSEKTQADGLHIGAKVKVQILGSDSARHNGSRGEIVNQGLQTNAWHVKLDVAGKVVFWRTKGENLILEQESSNQASKAVKIVDLRGTDSGSDSDLCIKRIRSCMNEVSLWKCVMSHANIVTLHEVFFDSYLCCMVMERCKGSIFKYMAGLPVLNERLMGGLLVQMILAIKHMHSYKVVHRDIKIDNLLMGGREGSTVKLCDYGLSAVLPEAGKLTGVHGTAPYMCPEMIELRLSDEKADVWSVGIVAYLLLCGKFPYQPRYDQWTGKKMQEMIRVGIHPQCERPWLSEDATSMLGRMLTRNPLVRPTAGQALRLRFIVDATLDCNVPEKNLPCLRPVLEAAVLLGTFQRNPDRECGLDEYLNFRQVKSHGRKVPPSDRSDIPVVYPREGNWLKAQENSLLRAMACNVAETYARDVSSRSSDDEHFSSKTFNMSESNARPCGSTCSTTVEPFRELTVFDDNAFTIKVEG